MKTPEWIKKTFEMKYCKNYVRRNVYEERYENLFSIFDSFTGQWQTPTKTQSINQHPFYIRLQLMEVKQILESRSLHGVLH